MFLLLMNESPYLMFVKVKQEVFIKGSLISVYAGIACYTI